MSPSNVCIQRHDFSIMLDTIMSICTFISLTFATIACGYHILSATRREWPKRTITLLSVSVFLIETAYSFGAFVGYQQLTDSNDNNSNYKDLCLIQGCLFNWSAISMVLLLVWFHFTQYQMLCKQMSSQKLQEKEPKILLFILFISTLLTILPVLKGEINARPNFYGCWLQNGLFYWMFYILLFFALMIANFWCYESVKWLTKVAESLQGGDRPEAIQSLKRYQVANIAIVTGTIYLCVTLLLSCLEILLNFKLGTAFCFIISLDILLFPLIFISFVHGFSWFENISNCLSQCVYMFLPCLKKNGKNKRNHIRRGLVGGQGISTSDSDNMFDAHDSIFEPFFDQSTSSRFTEGIIRFTDITPSTSASTSNPASDTDQQTTTVKSESIDESIDEEVVEGESDTLQDVF